MVDLDRVYWFVGGKEKKNDKKCVKEKEKLAHSKKSNQSILLCNRKLNLVNLVLNKIINYNYFLKY